LDRFRSNLGRWCWRARADRTLLDGICGALTGQSCGPAQAGVLPGESRAELRVSVRCWIDDDGIMRC
jgi:hypothetical protein